MKNISLLLLPLIVSIPITVAAQGPQPMPGDKPKTDKQMIGDTVTQPLSDINIRRRDIPPELLAIRDDPYSLEGIGNCRAIIAEVQKLDTVLGPDLDEIEVNGLARKRREGVAGAAGGLIASLIPFRSLIREVTGAEQADRNYRAAIYAGVVRRGFLKGYGQHRRCAAPGRPLRPLESAPAAAAEIMEPKNDK
jgi:hypothetical protein